MLSEGKILEIIRQLSKGLSIIHKCGVIHMAIRPQNIFVTNDVFKIGNFAYGVCANDVLPSVERLKQVGDVHFLPPEVFHPHCRATSAMDVFGLGQSMMQLALHCSTPSSSSRADQAISALDRSRYSRQLWELLDSMLHLIPEKRPCLEDIMDSVQGGHVKFPLWSLPRKSKGRSETSSPPKKMRRMSKDKASAVTSP